MLYALIAALLVTAIIVVATSSVFVKLLAAIAFAGAAYILFRQFQPAPAALVDAETTVTGAAQTAYKNAVAVEETIEQAVRSVIPASPAAPVAPVAPAAPVAPVAPVAPAPAAPVVTDTPKA